jgi:aspartate/methionine/tyrosine aminotransferase
MFRKICQHPLRLFVIRCCCSRAAAHLPALRAQVAQDLLSSSSSSSSSSSASPQQQLHGYGPAEGLPALREALRQKLEAVNGLTGVRGEGGGASAAAAGF